MVRVVVFMLLSIISTVASPSSSSSDKYLHNACSATRYPDLCARSLSPFSRTSKRNLVLWARAGVSVTIGEAKRVLAALKRNETGARGRIERGAWYDYVECFEDTLDNLHESLSVLRRLSVGEFGSQVDDVVTWVSASLTDEDTCVEGFGEGKEKGKRVLSIINRVSNVGHLTSNALVLINKLAAAGPECLVGK